MGLARVRWLYLRGLGLVLCLAFASLLPQLRGLLGPEGLSPAAELLAWAREGLGPERLWRLPTLLWALGTTDAALWGVGLLGLACGALLVANVAPRLALVGAWACYLSLVTVGGPFLGYQWDALLLETALVSLPLAPGHLRPPSAAVEPARGPVWLVRLLLFRLMLLSGLVKLASGDATWRDLTALEFHYWTQPLPNPVAWFVHQLPTGLHRASVVAMLAIELVGPFLLFAPRRLRLVGVGALALLQLGILFTGNYGFFNLLTLVLCLAALDDGVLARWQRYGPPPATAAPPRRFPRARRAAFAAFATVYLVLALSLDARALLGFSPPAPVLWAQERAGDFRAINTYGLFAVMTTQRHEIVLEGSADGVTWREYLLKWRPGRVDEAPRFAGPHMPRLDWQLWFAAFSGCGSDPWLLRLQEKLLRGEPAVRGFFREDPFPDTPPRYLRTRLLAYRFSDVPAWRATGAWWTREALGPYCPPLTLSGGRLSRANVPSGE